MITLNRPQEHLVESYLEFIEEMKQLGEKIDVDMSPKSDESFFDFVQNVLSSETNSANGRVPETIYWACVNETVVGRISLRHKLNSNLEEFGGHIGYDVRPSYRRKGIAKEILKQVIKHAKKKAIAKVLLTCDPNNIASNKTILACGGKLTKTVYVERFKRNTNYYWIDVI